MDAHPSLSIIELAHEAGIPVARTEQLHRLGLVAVGADGSFTPVDVGRIRVTKS